MPSGGSLAAALRTRFGLRLAVETVDALVWSALAPDTDAGTLITMVQTAPLAAELGFTQRIRGVALALVPAAAAIVVRRARKQPLRLDQLAWPLVSALPGLFVTRVDRWFYRLIEAAEADIAARVTSARRTARTEFSLVSHAVVDDLRNAAFAVATLTGVETNWKVAAGNHSGLEPVILRRVGA